MGRNCHKPVRSRGFTLIELLVVITIIVVLIGLVAVGFRALQSSQRANATGVAMGNLKGYLSEMKDRKAMPTWMPVGTVFLPPADNVESNPNDRYGELTIITQRALRAALQVPANRQAYNQLPKEKRMDVVRVNTGVQYIEGDQTYNASAGRYEVMRGGSWVTDDTPHTAVLVDGWNNPILYVPGPNFNAPQARGAYGLQGVKLEAVGEMRVVNPRSVPWSNNAKTNLENLKAYQPFWASAGPDGSFVKGDDNIYSFDQQ